MYLQKEITSLSSHNKEVKLILTFFLCYKIPFKESVQRFDHSLSPCSLAQGQLRDSENLLFRSFFALILKGLFTKLEWFCILKVPVHYIYVTHTILYHVIKAVFYSNRIDRENIFI